MNEKRRRSIERLCQTKDCHGKASIGSFFCFSCDKKPVQSCSFVMENGKKCKSKLHSCSNLQPGTVFCFKHGDQIECTREGCSNLVCNQQQLEGPTKLSKFCNKHYWEKVDAPFFDHTFFPFSRFPIDLKNRGGIDMPYNFEEKRYALPDEKIYKNVLARSKEFAPSFMCKKENCPIRKSHEKMEFCQFHSQNEQTKGMPFSIALPTLISKWKRKKGKTGPEEAVHEPAPKIARFSLVPKCIKCDNDQVDSVFKTCYSHNGHRKFCSFIEQGIPCRALSLPQNELCYNHANRTSCAVCKKPNLGIYKCCFKCRDGKEEREKKLTQCEFPGCESECYVDRGCLRHSKDLNFQQCSVFCCFREKVVGAHTCSLHGSAEKSKNTTHCQFPGCSIVPRNNKAFCAVHEEKGECIQEGCHNKRYYKNGKCRSCNR